MRRALTTALATAAASTAAAAAFGAAAPGPTSGRCAGAWNRTAPAPVLAVVRRGHVTQATAENVRLASVALPSGRAGRTASGCVIVFFLHRQTLSIFGTWRNGTVVRWSGPLYHAGTLGGSGNACVSPDGTIHRVGRFTASSRCP